MQIIIEWIANEANELNIPLMELNHWHVNLWHNNVLNTFNSIFEFVFNLFVINFDFISEWWWIERG